MNIYVIIVYGLALVMVMGFLVAGWFSFMSKDPVKHCEVYKGKGGCSHVDGIHCEMRTCSLREEYLAGPLSMGEWFFKNERRLDNKFNETGQSRNLDFDYEAACEKEYKEYLKRF